MKKITRVTEFLEWEAGDWTGSNLLQKDRAILIRWIGRICDYYQCSKQTFHYACGYLDRVSTVFPIPRDQLQLYAVGCMMIAFKLEEEEYPTLQDWQSLMENCPSIEEITKIELTILSMLDWRLYIPTSDSLLELLQQEDVSHIIDSALKAGIKAKPSLLACAALSTVLGNKKALELIPVEPKAMLACKLQISKRAR